MKIEMKKSRIGAVIFLLLIFATALERIPLLNYWDELITLFVVSIVLYKAKRNDELYCFVNRIKGDLIPLVIFIAIGLLGNVFHQGIQHSVVAIVKDILAVSKFPVVVMFLKHGYRYFSVEEYLEDIPQLARVLVGVTFVAAVVGYVVDIGMYTGEVRILNCFKFVFPHPTYLVSSYVCIMAIFFMDSIKKNKLYIILDCIIIFMAQRTKGYFVVVLALFLLFVKREWILNLVYDEDGKYRLNRKQIGIGLAIFAAIILLVGKNKIIDYISWGKMAARPALYIVGLEILRDMFPLGSGFGTFASSLSGEYYSKIYDMYGISGVWGLTPDMYNYMADTYWPYIYGQFGIFGCILYIKLLLNIIVYQVKRIKGYEKLLAYVIIWAYALFATTAEAYFTGGTGIQMALFIAFCFNEEK